MKFSTNCFRTKDVTILLGIKYARLHHWEARGVLAPIGRVGREWHTFSFVDLIYLACLREAKKAGIPVSRFAGPRGYDLHDSIKEEIFAKGKGSQKENWRRHTLLVSPGVHVHCVFCFKRIASNLVTKM